MSNLPALTALDLIGLPQRYERRPADTEHPHRPLHLNLCFCHNLVDEGLQTLSSLTNLRLLGLFNCPNLTAVAKQALRTAIPNLTIEE